MCWLLVAEAAARLPVAVAVKWSSGPTPIWLAAPTRSWSALAVLRLVPVRPGKAEPILLSVRSLPLAAVAAVEHPTSTTPPAALMGQVAVVVVQPLALHLLAALPVA